MSAKRKKGGEVEKIRFGRPRNNASMGIVGTPNVGKSTMFNVLSGMGIPAENYPFCTIDPNVARIPVPDDDFEWLCEKFNPRSRVPATLTVTDIAGLVRGASEGAGLGNEFLSHIGQVDGIYHVVRVFEDADVTHVEESIDPVRDLEIIRAELRAKDVQNVTRELETRKNARGGTPQEKKDNEAMVELLEKALQTLEAGTEIRHGEWSNKEILMLNPLLLLSAKPAVILVNMSVKGYRKRKNKHLKALFEYVQANMNGDPIVPFSAALEANLLSMGEDAAAAWLEENKCKSAVPRIIWSGREALHLNEFYTCGEDEVRAWTVREGTKAPQAAGVIHSDMEHGFICCEVYNLADIKEHETEAGVKAAGKYRQEGKNYVFQSKDVAFFKFNAPSGKKKKK